MGTNERMTGSVEEACAQAAYQWQAITQPMHVWLCLGRDMQQG